MKALPSSDHAFAFVGGDRSKIVAIVGDVLIRAGIASVGCKAAGIDRPVRAGLAASLAIEAMVLAYAAVTSGE